MLFPLRSPGANADKISVPASASVNNLHTGSAMLWLNVTTTAPAAQRNFWGKSTVGNRNVAFNNATQVSLQYGAGTGGSLLSMAVTTTNLAVYTADKWCCLFFCWSQGGSVPRVFCGDLVTPLTEAASYSTQTAGSAGSPNHDDSGAALDVYNSSGGTTGSIPGLWGPVRFWNRYLTPAEALNEQYRIVPLVCPVVSILPGSHGTSSAIDISGYGNHGSIATATLSGTPGPLQSDLVTREDTYAYA